MTNRRKLIIFIVFFLCFPLFAQNPAREFRYFEQKYPDELAVETVRRKTLQISMVDGKPEMHTEVYVETLILTDRVAPFTSEKVFYSPDNDIVEIEAYSLIPQGNRYRKIEVRDFSHSFDFSSFIFYDDTKACSFMFPSLTKGSKTVYRVRRRLGMPHFIPTLFFSQWLAVEKSEIIIEHDHAVEILLNEFAIEPRKLKTDTKQRGDIVTVTRELNDIPAMKYEENVESLLRYIPRLVPRIARYHPPGAEQPVNVLSSLDDLYRLYWSFLESIEVNDASHLQPLVDSLTTKHNSEFDKVKAIYYWVQENIRYVAIVDGDKGYVPADAAEVFDKRFGDCKGMSNLMYVMLKKAGVRSHLAWIGTRNLPYKYTELPSPAADNHMILCYFDPDGTPWFLDATAGFQSIMYVPSAIQGKECLVGIDSVTYKIFTIPYYVNYMEQHKNVEINGGTLNINTQQRLSGRFRQRFAYANVHKTAEEQRRIFERALASDGFAKSTVDRVEHSDLHAVDDTLHVAAQYRLIDYALVSGGTIYLKMFLNIPIHEHIDPDKRRSDFELSHRQEQRWTQNIAIPEGFRVDYLPESVNFEHPQFSFSANAIQRENNIVITAHYKTDFNVLARTDLEHWNEMNSRIRQFLNRSIVLKDEKGVVGSR